MNDLVILHLSDLHIDSGGHIYSRLHSALLNDIKAQMRFVPDDRLVIVVTGDIINKGDQKAISNAKKFFTKLKEITESKVKAIYIVPGNHDKKRTQANAILVPAYRGLLNNSSERLFDEQFQKFLWPLQMDTYEESGYNELIQYIYTELFQLPEIEKLVKNTFGVHVLDIEDKKFCFIMLNTAWSCYDENDNRRLILGKFQLDELDMQMRNTVENYDTDPASMTFVMGHHPIECLYGTEQDELFSHMVSYTNMCANAYLCGHTHDRKVINWSNNRHAMYTLMTGFGWPEEPSDHVREHFYSIYMFNMDLNSMDIYVRRTNDGSGFIPDLSIYTGSEGVGFDKLVRPIRFEEAQGAIELSAANNAYSKTVYASSAFLKYSKYYQDKLHEISLDAVDMIETYKSDFFENLTMDGIESSLEPSEIDDLILTFMKTPESLSNFLESQQDLIKRVMKRNSVLIYETFQGFIQWICQKFHRSLVEEVHEGQIVRFHFRYLNDKNTYTYSTLCSSFSVYDENDEHDNQPTDMRFGDLLEAAFVSTHSGTLIYSVNKDKCKNKLNEKWRDFITAIPKFDANVYSRRVNNQTTKRFPLITFGVTINSNEHERLLHCMDFYDIDEYISSLLRRYTNVFMLNIDEFLIWLKNEDRQEEH